jgi:hypothetical protein
MTDYARDGRESEWNEASYKAKRLHDIQELINYLRMDPLNMSNGKFFYLILLSVITILYKEGRSKYNDNEIDEIEKLRTYITLLIRNNPPMKKVYVESYKRKELKLIINIENWEKIKDSIEGYEDKVRFFNDIHGLSTRNADDYDDGL